ncbi:hypothetical protein LTR20_010065 [Exophiala xenobiotica]|nr:hypothetical protein LTS06_011734 [Exophiala xenobiotica]KAK5258809.1 hypothetical protein LTR40_007172 [Exophiala xenobiotica]KAK5363010.1 hypothetical protein LTS13_009336 [Exophiala xenobiotica]KAK5392079.1 hypothetical protein LTR79_010487 [Exophiala xenobiotica]KAK5407629.1 hypothetical protein LTR90_009803 [Exophiala xenobiotica]
MALGSRIRNVVSGNARKKASGSPYCRLCRPSQKLYEVNNFKFQSHNEAAIAGCFRCATIVDGLRLLAQKQSSILRLPDSWEDEAVVELLPTDDEGCWPLGNVGCSLPRSREIGAWSFKAQFYVDTDQTQPHHELQTRRHLTMDLPNGPLEFAAGAIQNCARKHHFCKPQSQSTLPKRLIEVTSVPEQDDTVRLIEEAASVLPSESQYAALSYCWGPATDAKSTMLKKTQADLSELTVGFPLSKMPAVFRDAVIATRLLKIRYLWIDALCIAQGDPDEWSRESVKMRDVYSSAYVTIVAASSASCDESFLAMLHRCFIEGFKLGRHPESMNRDVFVRLRTSRSYGISSLPQDFMSHPVDDRGWVLQEVLLSRRVLEFGNHCLAYSCLESSTCECGECIGECIRSTMRLREVFTSQVKETQPTPVWHGLVQNYTKRQLTVARDKLPAIAGLAAYLKSRGSPDNAYIAGLWTDTFVPDLTWHRGSLGEYPVSRMQTDGPSWSWVSADRDVDFWATGKNYMAHTKLVDHKCPYGTGGEFGIPKSAVITLEGPACPLRLVWDPRHATIQFVAHGSLARGLSFWNRRQSTVLEVGPGNFFEMFRDATDCWCLDHPLEVALLPGGTGRTVRPNLEAPDFENHGLDAMVDLLLLLVEERFGDLSAFFLILAKSDTHEQRYIRIGAFWQSIDRYQGFMGMEGHYRQRRWNRWIASTETKRFVVI